MGIWCLYSGFSLINWSLFYFLFFSFSSSCVSFLKSYFQVWLGSLWVPKKICRINISGLLIWYGHSRHRHHHQSSPWSHHKCTRQISHENPLMEMVTGWSPFLGNSSLCWNAVWNKAKLIRSRFCGQYIKKTLWFILTKTFFFAASSTWGSSEASCFSFEDVTTGPKTIDTHLHFLFSYTILENSTHVKLQSKHLNSSLFIKVETFISCRACAEEMLTAIIPLRMNETLKMSLQTDLLYIRWMFYQLWKVRYRGGGLKFIPQDTIK